MTSPASHPNVGDQSSHLVMIGLPQVYDMVQRLTEQQSRVEGKLDQSLTTHSLRIEMITTDIGEIRANQASQEMRLRALEVKPTVSPRSVWVALAALTSAIGVAVAIISIVIK